MLNCKRNLHDIGNTTYSQTLAQKTKARKVTRNARIRMNVICGSQL